jgi:hypothetical protein
VTEREEAQRIHMAPWTAVEIDALLAAIRSLVGPWEEE